VEKAITLGHFKSDEVKKVAKMVNKGWAKVVTKRNLVTTVGRRMR
jgi:helix-turn-helix protein